MNVRGLLMLKSILTLLSLFLFTGCLHQQPQLQTSASKPFAREDEYIMYALDAEIRQKYIDAVAHYDLLYSKTRNKEYLHRSVMMLLDHGSYDEVIARTSEHLTYDSSDAQLMRFKVAALVKKERLEEAKSVALELVNMTKKEGDYLIVSNIYHKQEHYDMALKYLESAYAIAYDEKILDTLVVTLYVNLDRQDEAISYLETHNRMHGCSEIACSRLAGFYSNQNNIEGMLSIYLRMYENKKNSQIAEAIINIYSYKKEFPKLIFFLEKYGANDEMLLRLYINTRNYSKAAKLANKIYQESGESYFLGQSVIFLYEANENKNDLKMLRKVMHTLRDVVKQHEDPLFLNYLGYLMIDHDLGVEEGIGYVNRALKIEPDSSFYLDSLAWGYYKQNRCKEAYELMQRVIEKLGSDDEEIQSHIKAIEKCLEEK